MPAEINELIEGSDVSELVRDQIASILATEIANQKTLAEAAAQDGSLWDFRVFSERSNPWEDWLNSQADARAIVNVSCDNSQFDKKRSTHLRQHADVTYHVDVHALGVSSSEDAGHDPGDARACLEAQRVAGLVRRILMAGQLIRLGMPAGVVKERYVSGIEVFRHEGPHSVHVGIARITFVVGLDEFSPEHPGDVLEHINIKVCRDPGTGEVTVAEVDIDHSPPEE